MLTEPSLFSGFVDSQSHGMFFKTNRVTRILCIHGVDNVVLCVHVNSSVFQILGTASFILLSRRVDKPEKIIATGIVFKMLVSGSVKDGFGMGYIGRVCKLYTGNGEGGFPQGPL